MPVLETGLLELSINILMLNEDTLIEYEESGMPLNGLTGNAIVTLPYTSSKFFLVTGRTELSTIHPTKFLTCGKKLR